MIAIPRPARPPTAGPALSRSLAHHPRPTEDAGALSLEAVLVLPAIALLVSGLLLVVGVGRDLLVLHEAARAAARTAATSSGTDPVVRAAREAAPELPDLRVTVTPAVRHDGDLVRVRVGVDRRIGPVTHRLRAEAVARVEPIVGTEPDRLGVGLDALTRGTPGADP